MTSTPTYNDDQPMLGRVLLGRYRIVRELARGGMGVVYLARAEGAEGFVKPVVVKLILRELATDERFLGMFAREAKILATLRDPSIVDVLEFEKEKNGDYVMVLEYVRGYHLGQWKRYLRKLGREVPTDIILQIAIDVLGALHHAHNARHPNGELMHIAHRDVSPSNILLDSDGRGRLLDFGVARMRGGGEGYKTQVKSVVGKLPYLSPELLSGADADAKSDLYAVGVVIHEVLYGKNVFRGDSDATTLYRVMHHIPEPVAGRRDDVPAGLDDVLARALAKAPEDRYQSAADFQRALRALAPHPEHEVRERLARLLEQDFGEDMAKALGIESLAERDDAWRRLSLLPRVEEEGAEPVEATAPDHRGATPRISRIPPPPMPSGSHPLSSGAHPLSGAFVTGEHTPVMTDPSVQQALVQAVQAHAAQQQQAKRGNGLVLAIAFIALVVAGGAAALLWHDSRSSSQANAAPIQVVQEPTVPSVPAPSPPDVADEPAAPVDEPADSEDQGDVEEADDETDARSARRAKRRRRAREAEAEHSGPDAAALTRAFRRKSGGVQQCFERHADQEIGAKIQVEFSIDARGRVERAHVQPRRIAATPLGKCLAGVAKTTDFPAQGQALQFAIPVSARALR